MRMSGFGMEDPRGRELKPCFPFMFNENVEMEQVHIQDRDR